MKKALLFQAIIISLSLSAPVIADINDVEGYFSESKDYGHFLTFAEHKGYYHDQLFIVDYFDLVDKTEHPESQSDIMWIYNRLSDASHEDWFNYSKVQLAVFNIHEKAGTSFSFFNNIDVESGEYEKFNYNMLGCGIAKNKSDLDNDTLAFTENTAMEILRNRAPGQYIATKTDDIEIEWFGDMYSKMFANMVGHYDSDDGKRYDFTLEFTMSDLKDGKWNYDELYTEINGVTLFGEYVNTLDYVIKME